MHFYQGGNRNKCTFSDKAYWVPFTINSVFCLFHPNYLCEYYLGSFTNLTYYNEINGSYLTYSVNDILSLMGLFQIYPILYHYSKNLTYNSDIAARCWYFNKQNKWV